MSKKCYCSDYASSNDSKAMCSIDYDSLIERLEEARDEIDAVIKTLYDRKNKDSMINSILSQDYEDENNESEDENKELEDKDINEILEILKDFQKQRYPYKYYWGDKYVLPYPTWTYF